jgi:hypothetical protein
VGQQPPATPAQKAPNMKAVILVLRVSTVIASAADSSSRTALRALPMVDVTKLLIVQIPRAMVMKITGRVAQSGCPDMPRLPPNACMFSKKLFTMKRKARLMIAR